MSEIEIKLYDLKNEEEVRGLYQIILEYYPQSPWPPSVEKIMQGSVIYFRAFHEGKQIGITGYTFKTPTLAETIKTTVFKEFRGLGLGSRLSQVIEDECKRVGIKKIISTVYYYNPQMVQIKMKQGYTIEGYHPDHEAPGFHEYSLGKVL